jgi:hypothetical protein
MVVDSSGRRSCGSGRWLLVARGAAKRKPYRSPVCGRSEQPWRPSMAFHARHAGAKNAFSDRERDAAFSKSYESTRSRLAGGKWENVTTRHVHHQDESAPSPQFQLCQTALQPCLDGWPVAPGCPAHALQEHGVAHPIHLNRCRVLTGCPSLPLGKCIYPSRN